jgi:hypothetical protein
MLWTLSLLSSSQLGAIIDQGQIVFPIGLIDFFIHGDFMQKLERYRPWVGSNKCSEHFPIVLELDKSDPNPRAPFKFNLGWASEEEFLDLVKVNWLWYDPS